MTQEQIQEIVHRLGRELGEHVDACQILVSWNEEAICKNIYFGTGNWFARQGMAHDFINQDVAHEHASQIGAKLEPPPDDAELWKK